MRYQYNFEVFINRRGDLWTELEGIYKLRCMLLCSERTVMKVAGRGGEEDKVVYTEINSSHPITWQIRECFLMPRWRQSLLAVFPSPPRAGQGTPHLSLFFPFSPLHLPTCAGDVTGWQHPLTCPQIWMASRPGQHGATQQASCPQSS